LRRAILSVKKSTLQDYEHLVISDHCPFASLVYNDFSDDERIKFVEVPDPYVYNLGAIPFNLGIKLAQADIVCYLLDDDVIYNNHLEEHYNFYQNNPNAKCYQSRYNQADLREPNNNVKFICSNSLEDLKKYNLDNAPWDDVGAMSHIKNIGKKWIPQTQCHSGWEDGVFMGSIGVKKPASDGPPTFMKVQWNGHNKKNNKNQGPSETKGSDEDYHNTLMSKLIKDEDTMSGYRVIADSPYVYDDLTNSLYG